MIIQLKDGTQFVDVFNRRIKGKRCFACGSPTVKTFLSLKIWLSIPTSNINKFFNKFPIKYDLSTECFICDKCNKSFNFENQWEKNIKELL